ncbi:hypothetical protein JOF29_000754 [Kribbella aluminosa]|uniref:DUF4097 domain-containing protein n=1 Tax=Kribbella aluminosa TaxID=416017 RepID=A0ABS4UDF9_9ACTN|nr:DUF4097 family beta strand repeat-containing protein [Kribbella aluminosa]MBP2349671.1 hypothetical protein [Kribbella aluminosa]
MTRAQRTMLLVGVLPLLAVLVVGGLGTVGAIRGKLPYSYTASFAPATDGVQITSDISTQIVASYDGQVHVSVDGTYAAQRPDVRVSTVGRLVVVKTMCPDSHCQVNLTVDVPAAAAVRAKVDGSSINVAGVAASLTVDVSDGSVDMAQLRSPQVSVDARGGSISMIFDRPPEQVSATSSDGSIHLQLPRSTTYAIDAVAAQGSTNLNLPSDASATHRVFLRSSYGSITVQ